MSKKKVHKLLHGEYWSETTYVEYAVCETAHRELDDAKLTEDWKYVTCKNCLKKRFHVRVLGDPDTGMMHVEATVKL